MWFNFTRILNSFFNRNVTGKALSGSHFGRGEGRVWMSDVQCNGTEHDIMQCKFDPTGGVNCDHRRDASVICNCKCLATKINNFVASIL